MAQAAGVSTANLLGMARTAELAENGEEAVSYYNRVLEIDPGIPEAWLGKARSVGGLSTLARPRLTEMAVAHGNAVGCASDEERPGVIDKAVDDLSALTDTLIGMSSNHVAQFAGTPGVFEGHLTTMGTIATALANARAWAGDDVRLLPRIVMVTKAILDGGVSADYNEALRRQRDEAVARLTEIDPSYAPTPLDAKTVAQAREEAGEMEMLGWIVAGLMMFALLVTAVAMR